MQRGAATALDSVQVPHYCDYADDIAPTSNCHAQSLAATNRVTEQLNWLTVESFYMSCSIIWIASLIDNGCAFGPRKASKVEKSSSRGASSLHRWSLMLLPVLWLSVDVLSLTLCSDRNLI